MAEEKKKRSSGEKSMRERGHTKVVVWLDSNETWLINAARGDHELATWVRQMAFHAAQKIQRKRQRELREGRSRVSSRSANGD